MKRHFSRSATLLLELAVAIAVFAMAGAVCARVLVAARDLSLRAEELDRAVEEVTSAAELLRGSKDPREALELLEQDPDLRISFREEGGLILYEISWCRDGETVYSLELVCPGEVRL